jgi:hypothetical protein
MSLSSYSGKEENIVHNLSLSYQADSCTIRWKKRHKKRENGERERGRERWKIATRNAVFFGCADEENKVGNWKTLWITKFDSFKSCKLSLCKVLGSIEAKSGRYGLHLLKCLYIFYEFYICFEYFHNKSNSLYRYTFIQHSSNCELDDFQSRVFAKIYFVSAVLLTCILSVRWHLSLSAILSSNFSV